MTQTAYSNGTVTRSTGAGSYTAGQDCSLVLRFDNSNPGGTSANFVAPTTFRVQMVDSVNGQLSVQTEAGNTLTGTFVAQ